MRILKLLEGGELCVCQIIAVLALSPSTISKHLFLMRSAGLVRDRKEKKWVHYSLAPAGDNPYADGILRELAGWLQGDPVIVADRARLAEAKRGLGPTAVCAPPAIVGAAP